MKKIPKRFIKLFPDIPLTVELIDEERTKLQEIGDEMIRLNAVERAINCHKIFFRSDNYFLKFLESYKDTIKILKEKVVDCCLEIQSALDWH